MQHSRPKVFFIGFNKTATISFHKFFEQQGYRSFHHIKKKKYLGKCILDNLQERRELLYGINNNDIYSDFCYSTENILYEATENFKLLDQQYPNSYFILQTRDKDDWIRSRFMHKSKNKEDFYVRAKKTLNLDEKKLKEYWLLRRKTLHKEIRDYFTDHPNFINFDIDNDPIDKIVEFLRTDYNIDSKFWKKYNATNS